VLPLDEGAPFSGRKGAPYKRNIQSRKSLPFSHGEIHLDFKDLLGRQGEQVRYPRGFPDFLQNFRQPGLGFGDKGEPDVSKSSGGTRAAHRVLV